jgi:hypothetical protein
MQNLGDILEKNNSIYMLISNSNSFRKRTYLRVDLIKKYIQCGDKMFEQILSYPGDLDASFDSMIIMISTSKKQNICLYIDINMTSVKIIKL